MSDSASDQSTCCPASRITGGLTSFLFQAEVLGKHRVSYYRCDQTGFIQTEEPYWLEEAYSDAIAELDVGLVRRNIERSAFTCDFIDRWYPEANDFADYGGGYGLFTRLMRDRGYPFRHFDPMCRNLFAKGFALSSLSGIHFELVTAWEVLEHLPLPSSMFDKSFDSVDALLFSTVLVPSMKIRSVQDWWYFTPETGQHVSFYTVESLQHLARQNRWHFYTDGISLHLFSRNAYPHDPFRSGLKDRLRSLFRKDSTCYSLKSKRRKGLVESDYNRILAEMHSRRDQLRSE